MLPLLRNLSWPTYVLTLLALVACGAPQDMSQERLDGPMPDLFPTEIRPEVAGTQGAVVAGHPLAAAAGYEVLRAGGTAADAAVTMAAVLAVVRPHMNGVGGDAFALFYDGQTGAVEALNASGRAAAGATPDFFLEQDLEAIPETGPLSVTVPGAVSGWAAALERHGTMSLAQALAPAIRLAEEGFVVTTTLESDVAAAVGGLNEAARAVYAPGGSPTPAGSILRSPALAGTLRTLAREGPGALYGGGVGASLARFLEEEGSPLRLADFTAHSADWTSATSIPFRDRIIHTLPPNSQGMTLLQMLGIAEARGLGGFDDPRDPELLHILIEAKKLAFADRDRWVADADAAPAPLDQLLDPEYLARRAGEIGSSAMTFAAPGALRGEDGGEPTHTDPVEGSGDTVYLIAVDSQGNAVSWIQSLFHSFGSGLMDPATGIMLQNRGGGFTLEEGHPSRIAPGRRPFHTLMATLVTHADGSLDMALGTPGGHGQPQTVAQALVQMLLFDLTPQQAAEAPRFRSYNGRRVSVETRFPEWVNQGLIDRGHEVTPVDGWTAPFGNLQIVRQSPDGVLRTGADMRREAAAAAY